MPVVTESSWEQKFLELLPLLDKIVKFVAHRHRLSRVDVDDFRSDVKIKLIQDNYAVLRKFEGRSSMRTFLTMVIVNALQDRRDAELGKWRPSAEACRGGPDAMLLERLLVRDGLSFDDAVQTMTTNHGVTRTRSDLERLASRFPTRFRRRFESDDVLSRLPSPDCPDAGVFEQRRQAAWARVMPILHEVQKQLDSKDALILAMRFQEGMQVSAIAQILGLDAKRLYDHLYKLRQQLREALEAHGIDLDFIQELFEDQDS